MMYQIGDLVRITKSAYYLHGKEIEDFYDEDNIDGIGLVNEIRNIQGKTIYKILLTKGTKSLQFYYQKHEIEKV